MARIPTVQRSKDIQPQATAAKAQPQAFGQEGRNLRQFGEISIAAENSFRKLHDANQVLNAKNGARKELQDIRTSAATDPDPFTIAQRSTDSMGEVGQRYSKTVNNPNSRHEFDSFFATESYSTGATITNESRKRQIQTQQVALFDGVDSMVQQYYGATDPNDRRRIVNGIGLEFDKARANLWIDPVASRKYQEATLEEMRKGQVFYDMANLPTEAVIAELEAAGKGKYAGLKPEERSDMIKEAQNLQKRNNTLAETRLSKAQDENTDNIWIDMLTPGSKYTLDNAVEALQFNDIDNTQFQKIRKFLTSENTVDPAINLQTYNEIRDLQTGNDPETGKRLSKQEVSERIRDRASEGKLSYDNAKLLMEKTYAPVTTRRDNQININKRGLKSQLEKMLLDPSKAFLEESGVTRARIDEYLYRYDKMVDDEQAEGERLDEIMQEIGDSAVRDMNPELSGQKELTDVIVTVDKKVKRIMRVSSGKGKKKTKAQYTLKRSDTE